MSYASWATPSKTTGNCNDTVNWSATAHTGRTSRTTTAIYKASGVSDVPLAISQVAKPEFVDIAATAAVAKTGGNVTITGTSNSKKLTFTLGSGQSLELTLPSGYSAVGTNTVNGADIAGDPGATAQYTFQIVFTGIAANGGITALTHQLTVETDGGQTDTCTITQAAGDPTLSIAPTTISLTAAGTAVSVAVTSNTNWSIV